MEDVLDALETTEEEPLVAEAEGAEPNAAGEEEPGAPVTSLFDDTGRRINPAVKAILGKLRTSDPGAERLLSKAIFRTAELEREFPGGLAEARELRDKVEGLGGLEEIQGRLQAAEQFNGLAGAYENADPAFVQDLVESYPESFKALGPVFLQQYAKLDPDGYSGLVLRTMHADFQSSGFLLTFQRLADFIPADSKGIEQYNALSTYLRGIGELAGKAPTAGMKPKEAAPKNDEVSKRESDLTRREWDIERKSLFNSIAGKEYKTAIAGKTLDDEDKADIEERFRIRAENLTKQQFPDLMKRLEAFTARKDKEGFFRYLKSVYAKVVPQAVTAAVAGSLRHKPVTPGTKPAAVVNKPGQALPRVPPKPGPTAGFKPVAKQPGPYEIDYSKTTKLMIEKGDYVLKTGQKVQYR